MTTKFVMVLLMLGLAACSTATTGGVALRSDAPPAVGRHRPVVRGPVVPDRVEPAARPLTAVNRAVRVVPNPLSQTATTAPAAAPATASTAVPASPSEPAQSASATVGDLPITEQPSEVAPAPLDAIAPYPTNDSSLEAKPGALSLDTMTPAKIEAMFGGMPFLLIAAIVAALVASFGVALRQSPNTRRGDYADHAEREDHLDHREPYAA